MAGINETTDWGDNASADSLGYLLKGYTVSGTLSGSSDVDWIRLPMASGETYNITVSGANASISLISDSSTLATSGSSISHTALHPSSGYFVAVSGSGSYSITVDGVAATDLADEAGASTATTATLAAGGTAAGVINGTNTSPDADWFAVQLTAGASYSWSMTPVNSPVGATAGGSLKLYDSSGNDITSDTSWDASAWTGANLSFTPSAGGTYYLSAETYFGFNDAGSYLLSMSENGDTPTGTATVRDAFATEGGNALVEFQLDSAQSHNVTVTYRTVSGTATDSGDFTAVSEGSVTFLANETSKQVAIAITDDAIAEGSENFYVQITGVSGGQLSASNGIFGSVTVTDNDSADPNGLTLTGTAGADTLLGGDGADTITSGNGNDSIVAGLGKDYIDASGTTGDKYINGGNQGDTILGGLDNDELRAGKGLDSIVGGTGNDTMFSGLGRDTMIGGDGADVFVVRGFDARFPGAILEPTIMDFVAGVDVLAIQGVTQAEISAALAQQQTVSGNVELSISGATVTLIGLSTLSSADVVAASDLGF
ncbi:MULTISPECIES: Calx-beta domain-containing protein [Oceanibaculum]|uniref:Hemolysin type calcium-binding protein n=1 Tax=Oceanibaculum indicum TaxID=526216 RepID=A0A420WN46_9PROT|nr:MULTISPECIES: Calx-beta domain-containing protein [Oceanibaculum]MCH2393774.1 hypothetical protein [Oceanibaculum sp.]RKQ72437.1 hemolysin type calcium-binding protein [Oceanibaculum indicum]